MISVDDLAQAAEDLRRRGIDAAYDFLYGAHGCIEGLNVGDDFFPRWELSLAENSEALKLADFEAIRRRRGPDWTAEPPRPARAAVSSGWRSGSAAR
jgi:hypothetical protein